MSLCKATKYCISVQHIPLAPDISYAYAILVQPKRKPQTRQGGYTLHASGSHFSDFRRGVFHGSTLRQGRRLFAPDASESGLDLLLEAGNQFAVGGDQGLFGFDLRHDRLLGGEGWEGNAEIAKRVQGYSLLRNTCGGFMPLLKHKRRSQQR